MNVLTLNVQPQEGISLTVEATRPGTKSGRGPHTLHFDYRDAFDGDPPEAYERLPHDCMPGDHTLFVRADDTEASWAMVADVLHTWERGAACASCVVAPYSAGSVGPDAANALIEACGRRWCQVETI